MVFKSVLGVVGNKKILSFGFGKTRVGNTIGHVLLRIVSYWRTESMQVRAARFFVW